jgi:hypothetical protein
VDRAVLSFKTLGEVPNLREKAVMSEGEELNLDMDGLDFVVVMVALVLVMEGKSAKPLRLLGRLEAHPLFLPETLNF